MVNPAIFHDPNIAYWKESFQKAKPFRFVVIDNFLDKQAAAQLATAFPSLADMHVNYKGINERKSEHSDFDKLHPSFAALKKALAMPQLTSVIEGISGIHFLELINDRYGFGLHQGGRHSFLDIHADYNLHPLKKKQRRLNLILFLNESWEKDWGGALEFWNRDVSACGKAILPLFNRCVLFECHDHSFHGYSKIECPEGITRKSFYQYYFTQPDHRLVYHDTIFKNRPEEAVTKKMLVTVKEFAKNTAKRAFYYLGFERFLK